VALSARCSACRKDNRCKVNALDSRGAMPAFASQDRSKGHPQELEHSDAEAARGTECPHISCARDRCRKADTHRGSGHESPTGKAGRATDRPHLKRAVPGVSMRNDRTLRYST
jgi:hypothetical protein